MLNVRRPLLAWLALFAFSGVLTMISHRWIGDATIYREGLEASRLRMHSAVLHNALPANVPTWTSIGANGANIRIAAVVLAEHTARITSLNVLTVYKIVDLASLFALFPVLFIYLRRYVPTEYALIGLLFTAAILPLTYFLHAFHPWDRPSWLCWAVLLLLLAQKRMGWFALALAVTITIKYDAVLLPGLYFLTYYRTDGLRRAFLMTGALFALSFGLYGALLHFLPGGAEPRDVVALVSSNVARMREMNFGYPPLLVFLFPAGLAILRWRDAEHQERASILFAAGMTAVFFVQTHFAEVRAEVCVLFLLLPSALRSLWQLLSAEPVVPRSAL